MYKTANLLDLRLLKYVLVVLTLESQQTRTNTLSTSTLPKPRRPNT